MTALRNLAIASSLVALVGCDGVRMHDPVLTERTKTNIAKRDATRAEVKRINDTIAKYTTSAKNDAVPTPQSGQQSAPAQQPTPSPANAYEGKIFRILSNTKNPAEYTVIFWSGACAYDRGQVSPEVDAWMAPYLQEQRHAIAIASMPKHRTVRVEYRAMWPSTGCIDVESLSVPAWKKK